MENIYNLVNQTLAGGIHEVAPPSLRSVRRGFVDSGSLNSNLDHTRLQWSRWFRCESSFSVLLVPAKAGIFALGEEMVPAGDGSKRMLALFEISATDDLGMTLGRLFLPGNPLLAKLNAGRCFARYTVIEDAAERSAAYSALRRWMQDSAETASGISPCGAGAPAREVDSCGSDTPVRVQPGVEPDSSSSINALKNNSP